MTPICRQQGVALISVLAVFSLVVVLMATRLTRDQADLHRASHYASYQQALQYALGAETLARQQLFEDWRLDKEKNQPSDSLRDSWAKPHSFDPDRGEMKVRIRDLQARFNLNNLVTDSSQPDGNQLAIIQRLLRELQLPDDSAMAIIDWLDQNTLPGHHQSEDSALLSMTPARRSAEQPMAHRTELQALGIFSSAEIQRLYEYVTALPGNTTINPNTASEILLSSLQQNLDGGRVIAQRQASPFASTADFYQSEALFGLNLPSELVSVRSEYFEVDAVVQLDEFQVYLRSCLHRDPETGQLTVLWRTLLNPALAADWALPNHQSTEP